ncbi:MAG: hypothetical protein Q9191_004057 [Dirinaria sp. TL-2023a]
MSIQALSDQILETEKHLADLRHQLEQAQASNNRNLPPITHNNGSASAPDAMLSDITTKRLPLDLEEYKRYGRQMIVPSFGLEGQLKLKNAKLLIVGAGGLGCPAAMYLAGAGVGTLGLVDGDEVELSNLHRQVLHSVETLGMLKVESATRHLTSLNPNVRYQQHPIHLTTSNALDIIAMYDLILDCTDHPKSRYLISDACVLTGKPLISASALRTDGQLVTLNVPPGEGPCYRCVFPKPPPADSVISCGDGGIVGPVVGVMGVLMAAKAIEMITLSSSVVGGVWSDRATTLLWQDTPARLLIYSAFDAQPFRSVTLGRRRKNCCACSAQPSITKQALHSGSLDYAAFCGLTLPLKLLSDEERITAAEYQTIRDAASACTSPPKSFSQHVDSDDIKLDHLLIDVREKLQYDICHISGSLNVPFSEITAQSKHISSNTDRALLNDYSDGHKATTLATLQNTIRQSTGPVYFLCRFGNDSQEAVKIVNDTFPNLMGTPDGGKRFLGDIKGGLHAWSKIEPTFPSY